MSDFEVCQIGTLQRLAQVEAELRSMRLCFEVTELERSKYKAERDALKTENERLNGMLSAANWHRAQEEHNALRAERDALVDEKYRLRHLLAQARFFVDRAPHGDERDCPVCEFVNRIDAALAEKGGGNG